MQNLFLFFGSFIVAFFGVLAIRKLSLQNSWYSSPSLDRWHKSPTALLGGVGFIPIILFFQFLVLINQPLSTPILGFSLILGAMLMFLLGLIDDIWPTGPIIKLLLQIAAASIFIHTGGLLNLTTYAIINILLTYLWFIVIINSLNMLDNMDGLAIGVAFISILSLVLISIPSIGNNPLIIQFGIIMLGSFSAFWLFNNNPASIFMGDSGSLSIGFILAALAIPSDLNFNFGLSSNSVVDSLLLILILLALLSVQLVDFIFVTINRLLKGKKPYVGGKDHTSHSLVKLGMSDKQAVILLYFFGFIGGILAILLKYFKEQVLIYGIIYFIILSFFAIYLSIKVEKNINLN